MQKQFFRKFDKQGSRVWQRDPSGGCMRRLNFSFCTFHHHLFPCGYILHIKENKLKSSQHRELCGLTNGGGEGHGTMHAASR